jgi:serine/threonine protein kinase
MRTATISNQQSLRDIPNLPFKLGACLGQGIDGSSFTLLKEPLKVVKLSWKQQDQTFFANKLRPVLQFINERQPIPYVRVYDYGSLDNHYYYLMDRLFPLTDDEWKVFHSILSHNDTGVVKSYSLRQIEKTLVGLSRGLDFQFPNIMVFCKNLEKSPLQHLDIHPRNILKDDIGNYKLVDLDFVQLKHSTI